MTQAEAGERGAKVRFPPPLVYLVSILLGVAIRYAAAPLAVAAYRYLALAAGVAVLLAGLGLIAGAWTLFRRTGQDPKPWKPTPEIVLSGPYRFTRNPVYLGLTCIQIGLGLALNNLWISLLGGVFAFGGAFHRSLAGRKIPCGEVRRQLPGLPGQSEAISLRQIPQMFSDA